MILIRGRHRCSQHGVVKGGVMPPEMPAPLESNTQGEEHVFGLDSIVVRDDDGMIRSFQGMSKGLDSPSVLK
jgi:hypothetical protein